MPVLLKVSCPAIGIVDNEPVASAPLLAAFEKAGQALDDFMPWFTGLEAALERAEARQFDSEGSAGPVAGAWAPLSELYAERKLRRWGPKPILQASGTMMRALTTGGGNALRVNTGKEFAFGTQGVEYASYHQLGTDKMVARPPMDLDDQFKADFNSEARDFVRAALKPLEDYATISPIDVVRGLDADLDRIARGG